MKSFAASSVPVDKLEGGGGEGGGGKKLKTKSQFHLPIGAGS